MPALKKVVLDSFALIGYLENEAFSGRVENLFYQARQNKIRIHLHAIHLGEVYYIIFREQGADLADLSFARIKALPLLYIDVIDENLLRTAARFKAIYPISYADSFAAALAVNQKATLLTGDPEFKMLEEKEELYIEWIN